MIHEKQSFGGAEELHKIPVVTLESERGSAEMSVCTELALGVVLRMFSRCQRAGINYA